MRVVDPLEHLGLVAEEAPGGRVAEQVGGQVLDRHRWAAGLVPREHDLALGARPQLREFDEPGQPMFMQRHWPVLVWISPTTRGVSGDDTGFGGRTPPSESQSSPSHVHRTSQLMVAVIVYLPPGLDAEDFR